MNERFRTMYRSTRPDEKTINELRERLAKEKNHSVSIKYPLTAAACIAVVFSCFLIRSNTGITEYGNAGTSICEGTDFIPGSEYAVTEAQPEDTTEMLTASELPDDTAQTDIGGQSETTPPVSVETEHSITEKQSDNIAVTAQTDIGGQSETAVSAITEADSSYTEMYDPYSLGNVMERLGYDGGNVDFEISVNDGSRIPSRFSADEYNVGTYDSDSKIPRSCYYSNGSSYDELTQLLSGYAELSPTEKFDFEKYSPGTEYAEFIYKASDGRTVYVIIDSEQGIYAITSRPNKEIYCYGFDSRELFEQCLAYTEQAEKNIERNLTI